MSDLVNNERKLFAILRGVLLRAQVEPQLVARPPPPSIGQADLECLRSKGGGKAFGLASEIHDHAILVRQLRMHLPLDQCESAADAMVSSGKIGEPV